MNIAENVLAGDRRSLARLLSFVENDTQEGRETLDILFPHTGRAHLIGVTGASGVGKSSLVNQLALVYRKNKNGKSETKIAIVAVDPTSPFTGGAVLGDRIRMRDLSGDTGVFIRSMATRGSLGGLASATGSVVQVLDAAGFDKIIIETVGAGQAEVDIAKLAHTTIVIEAPGMGDDIQAIKAGILEIADILVINKADHPGVENTEMAIQGMLHLTHPVKRVFMHHDQMLEMVEIGTNDDPSAFWQPKIIKTISIKGEGIDSLMEEIQKHEKYLHESGGWKGRDRLRLRANLDGLIKERLVANWKQRLPSGVYEQIIGLLLERKLSPQRAVDQLMEGEVKK